MRRLIALYGVALALGYLAAAAAVNGCYAHAPTPSCAQDPSQDRCYPPLHDRTAPDAGR